MQIQTPQNEIAAEAVVLEIWLVEGFGGSRAGLQALVGCVGVRLRDFDSIYFTLPNTYFEIRTES